jgi:DNA repair protein RadC
MKCHEVKISVVREAETEYKTTSPADISRFWDSEIRTAAWFQDEKEHFVVICLSAKNYIKTYNLVSLGLLDSSLVHPREVFRPAIIAGSANIIVTHNHPSGDTTPSSEDLQITRRIVEAGKIIGINLLDHVIIGNSFNSLRKSGTVDFNR